MSKERRGSAMLDRPVMRDEFRRELRSRLMAQAAVELAPRPAREGLVLWLRPALAAAVVAILVFAGATSVAASSIPGDSLYDLKRAGEEAQLALTFDDVARMRLLSELADRRLAELAEVARRRPDAAPTATAQYADALERVASAVKKVRGSSADSPQGAQAEADDIEAAQEKRLETLDSLKEKVPDNARSSIDDLIQREKDRRADEDRKGEGKTADKENTTKVRETPRGATPPQQRVTTPRATPKATPTERRDEDHN